MFAFKEHLKDHVDEARNVHEMMGILEQIPLEIMKKFALHQIDELITKNARISFYNTISINNIFSHDVMQYILFFGGLYHTKAVCRTWNTFSQQNEGHYLKSLYSSIHQELRNLKPINQMHVIHPYRSKLHSVEIEMGFTKISNCIDHEMMKKCHEDDVLVVHGGCIYGDAWITKGVKVIGLGNSVEFRDISVRALNHCAVRIKNVTAVQVDVDEGSLYIEDCAVRAVEVESEANAVIDSCDIDGSEGSIHNEEGVRMSEFAGKVDIINCWFSDIGARARFTGQEQGCITVGNPNVIRMGNVVVAEEGLVDLKCIDNVFVNVSTLPILELYSRRSRNHIHDKPHKYKLAGNKLSGYHGNRSIESGIIDANKLYAIGRF